MTGPNVTRELLYRIHDPLVVLTDKTTGDFDIQAIPDFVTTGFSRIPPTHEIRAYVPALPLQNLGSSVFLKRHGITYPYVAGAMANGITSADMVVRMAENGMMAFFGSGGLSLERIRENIEDVKIRAGGRAFGFNLIHSLGDPDHEMATVRLYLENEIRRVSAAAFMRMTPSLVYYRIKGIHEDENGRVVVPNHVVAKVSRIEVARQFFAPPPEKMVAELLENQMITRQEAILAKRIPMAHDLTAEADSGGHTDNRPALTLLPTMIALKNEFETLYDYDDPLCVGLAGGIATPQSTAAAFQMGAAYVLTGSVNQSCVEAGMSGEVKELLCQAQQPDVAMAPSADMFEIGARVQVLKRGTLFPVRAEKLYQVYRSYERFEDVPAHLRKEIEEKFLNGRFEHKWEETKAFFESRNQHKEVEKALGSPRQKMALVFRSYLGLSSKWAIEGDPGRKMDYQVWCGPSMGAFNQWVKGTVLESVQNRRVADVALNLLFGAAVAIRTAFLRNQGIELSETAVGFSPLPLAELTPYLHARTM